MTVGRAPMIRIDLRSVRLGIRGVLQVAQGLGDGQEDAVNVLQHVVVPEAQRAIAMCDEPSVAHLVGRAVGMLAAIHLDNELCLQAGKVCDEWADRTLLAKVKAIQLLLSQVVPQLSLTVRQVATELARTRKGSRLSSTSLCFRSHRQPPP